MSLSPESKSSHLLTAAALSVEPHGSAPSTAFPGALYKRRMDGASAVQPWTHWPLNRVHTREQLLINAVFINFLEDEVLIST